jgi:hypothetical protein
MFRIRCACICLACFVWQVALTVETGNGPNRLLADQGNGKKPAGKKKAAPAHPHNDKPVQDVNHLSMEVKALRVLRGLQATPAQIAEVARTGKKTGGKRAQREPAKAANSYVDALKELRNNLVANDEEKIEAAREKVEDLEEKESPDIDDTIEISDAAEIEAVRLLNLFSPQQVGAYADNLGDDFPDPVKAIADALDQSRDLKGDEWKAMRDDLADKISWLVGGLNGEKTLKIEQDVSKYLDQKHKDGGKANDAEIRQLMGSPGPIVLLKNVVEHDLAELLSNSQLGVATRACLHGHGAAVAAEEEPQAPPARKPRREPEAGPPAARPHKAEHKATVADLDEVLKSPDHYDDQNLKFENVTITGTAQARLPNMLWLEVKSGSGETVRAALRGQKLTFVIAKAAVPESITQMTPGTAVPATLVCHVKGGGQPKHWMARVQHIEVRPPK